MLHTKFQGRRSIASGEEIFILLLFMIWAWRPCSSSDAEHLNNFCFIKALEAVYEISLVSEEKSFEIVDSRRMTYSGRRSLPIL